MNCANHPDIAAIAYCRTCGKPLCANCTRDVKGVIYCENCLADRLQGVQPTGVPAAGFVASTPGVVALPSGPNPTVAGILAGFFPIGVGAVYCGQYVKGLVNLGIMVFLIVAVGSDIPWFLHTLLGISIAFFWFYQVSDAVRTAKAIQAGQPAPDPFGLAQAFGAAEPVPPGQPMQPAQATETTGSSKIPTAAVVLIGLGVLFLLQTAGVFEFGWDRVWPFFLIGLGVWMFVVREGWVSSRRISHYRSGRRRTMVGPVVLVTVGLLSLLESYDGPGWHRTWPVLLLAIGITKLLESKTPPPPPPPLTPPGPGSIGGLSGDVQVPSSEVRNG
jgi:hypothetical protein